MHTKSLNALEFNKIVDMLSQNALTELGKNACLEIEPSTYIDEIEKNQQETSEALFVLENRGIYPISYTKDISDYLALAQKGSTLSMRALIDIADFLQASSNTKRLLSVEQEGAIKLNEYAGFLSSYPHIYQDIRQSILSEDEMADNASSELSSIRRNIRATNDKIKDRLQNYIRQGSHSNYLQEAIITMRNGRYVIPVKLEYRQQVPGLVHDQSSTGATLFIEPFAVVEAGNELKQWLSKEEQEIERILIAFTAQISSVSRELTTNLHVLSHLDFVFAKARLAKEMYAIKPKMNDKGYLRFVKVRHPLLDKSNVVPCDLHLGIDFTSLIITGPNTGGKTVTLKTIGLMALMAQAGLHIPGEEGTELAVFSNIYADIGDEQSIEQSLSTFSSHMTNIVEIIKNVENNDLVLFDELGAGTDPTEGAALAQSILNYFLGRNIRTAATTHYSELKAYAISTKNVENASVEFNIRTLRPSYKLSIGIAGKSNAFEISRRLGLPEDRILEAQRLISHEDAKFEEVLSHAEEQLQMAREDKLEIEALKNEAINAKNQAEVYLISAKKKYDESLEKAKADAKKSVDKAKREIFQILADLKEIKQSNNIKAHEIAQIRDRLSLADSSLNSKTLDSPEYRVIKIGEIQIGTTAKLISTNSIVTILTLPDSKNEVMIQAGVAKMRVNINNLSKVNEEKNVKKTSVFAKTESSNRYVPMECDVRGLALDEAILEVDKYLDMAVINSLHEVSIIHGKGTGVLRTGLQKHLKGNPHVKSIRAGLYGEGEAGVTVVSLK